ncbi:MAG: hypothetical protein WAK39_16960, partial [Pseudolabrys sp.]
LLSPPMIEKDAVCCGAFARISDILTDAQISVFEGKADIQIDSAVTGQSRLTRQWSIFRTGM